VLNGTLALFDVRDTEALAARALEDQLRGMSIHLGEHDHEDALAYLVATVWEVSRSFDPGRSRSFEHYAYSICRRRAIDWFRSRYRTRWSFSPSAQHTYAGSTYERQRPDLLSFDDQRSAGELDGALSGGTGEFEAGGLDLERALNS
jgi:DNA-directed RNA polymerase specialized sigma24 family protein